MSVIAKSITLIFTVMSSLVMSGQYGLSRESVRARSVAMRTCRVSETSPPDSTIDVTGWKLQIPGPKDIKDVQGYSSGYFYFNAKKEMCFHLDCAEKGHTANSEYVRSELRHLPNWRASDSTIKHLAATISLSSQAKPNKVTVLQIHGIEDNGDNAPPLLRVAVNDNALYAFIKTDNNGKNTESVLLLPTVGDTMFHCAIDVQNNRLKIRVNGEEKVNRNLSFWTHTNYFKAGCYPQAKEGVVTVVFRSLEVQVK
jgi:Alginate lyase